MEAISLSILVGSSVDYCLHLVEGYLLAGETLPATPEHSMVRTTQSDMHLLLAHEELNLHIIYSTVREPNLVNEGFALSIFCSLKSNSVMDATGFNGIRLRVIVHKETHNINLFVFSGSVS